MEQITIKIHYKGVVTEYPIEGEKVGDYAIHKTLHGPMFNGRAQHGPKYTLSTPSGYTLLEDVSIETARVAAAGLIEFVTGAELERITADDGRTVAELATLNMVKHLIREYSDED